MNSDPLTLIKDVAIIALVVSGFALCLTLTIGLVRILPSLRRSLFNLEKASEAAPEVAANAVTTSQAIAAAAEDVKKATGDTVAITGHVVKAARVLRLLSPVTAVADSTTTSVIRVLDIVKGLLLRRRP